LGKEDRGAGLGMIELRDITKSYKTRLGRKYVFRKLNAIFPEGKNIGILGPNGAGKSTLLSLIGKNDYPDSGEVITDKKISWRVGLSGGFQGSLSGRDNVKFVCRINGSNGDITDRIAFVQEFAGLGDYFDLPVKTYSSGMRARLAFGLSMAFDFDYYLVDEVTAVGDRFFKEKSNALFTEKLKKSNIIIVSHQIEKLRPYCDIGVIVNAGHLQVFNNITDAIKCYKDIKP
jgi:capsular polysaccharide transport system ATP-binding protein